MAIDALAIGAVPPESRGRLNGAMQAGMLTGRSLFGGGVQSSLSGSTVVEKNLDRVTLFVTGIWIVSIVGMALSIKYGV